MKRKQILSTLLALLLCITMLPTSVFASNTSLNYLALGDSITTGYGLVTNESSFVDQFAYQINASITTNLGVDGLTSSALLSELQKGSYDSVLETADVITITIGGNDLMNALYEVMAELYNASYGSSGSSITAAIVQDALSNPTNYSTTFAVTLINLLSSNTGVAYVVSSATDTNGTLYKAMSNCIANINAIAAYINSVNPDAVILLADQYNPYQWLGIGNISSIFASCVTVFNSTLSASNSAGLYTIVNIGTAFASSTSSLTNATINLSTSTYNLDFHPNATGHTTIAATMKTAFDKSHIHSYGEPDWKWSGTDSATATFTCSDDSTHQRTLTATINSDTTAATCSDNGKTIYTATVSLKGVTYTDMKTVTIDASHTLEYVAAVGATATSEGNIAYYKCSVCGKYFSDAEGKNEIDYEDTVIAKLLQSEISIIDLADTTTTSIGIAYDELDEVNSIIESTILNNPDAYESLAVYQMVVDALSAGKSVSYDLVITDSSGHAVSSADVDTIKAFLSSSQSMSEYFNTEVVIKIDGQEVGTLDSLSKDITLTISLGDDVYDSSKTYSLVQLSNGTLATIDATAEGSTISFKTNLGSATYAVVVTSNTATVTDNSTTKTNNTSTSNNPQTSDNASYVLYIGVMILTAGYLIINKKNIFNK